MAPTDRSIQPWLVADLVREPTIGAAHGNIKDKIKCCLQSQKSLFIRTWKFTRSKSARTLIERSRVSTARPRVGSEDLLRAVRNRSRKLTTLEERHVETQVEHVLKTAVDVNTSVL